MNSVEHTTQGQSRAPYAAVTHAGPPAHEEMVASLDAVCRDPDAHDVIYRARNRIVVRHPRVEGGTFIIKLWARPDFKGAVRRLIGRSAPRLEWVNLQRFRSAGVRVPTPFGFLNAPSDSTTFTEALFLEDLGRTISGMSHLGRLAGDGLEEQLHEFETRLIEMTARCLDAGLLDKDHGLVNTVVPADGQPVRLDLELARQVRMPHLYPSTCGEMLGNLMGTYAFAVQPDTERATRFAIRLAEGVSVPHRILRLAARRVQFMMDYQRRMAGIHTEVQLPWA